MISICSVVASLAGAIFQWSCQSCYLQYLLSSYKTDLYLPGGGFLGGGGLTPLSLLPPHLGRSMTE